MNICIAKVIAAWLAHSCLYMHAVSYHAYACDLLYGNSLGISCDVICLFNFGT